MPAVGEMFRKLNPWHKGTNPPFSSHVTPYSETRHNLEGRLTMLL